MKTKFFHCNNKLYFFSSTRKQILETMFATNIFLSKKGLNSASYLPFLHSVSNGVKISGWNFNTSNFNTIYTRISLTNLKNYKRNLKLIIKSSSSNNFFTSLEKLNSLIYNWSTTYCFIECDKDIWGHLDVYVHKLLWSWAKKRHPRRPNTWIYSKYWKFFPLQNIWKFFFIDVGLTKCLFLRSHKTNILNIYCVPHSMNICSLKNYNKLCIVWLRKCSEILDDLFLCLYKKQFGRCFCCNKLFVNIYSKFGKVVIVRPEINNLKKYALIHNYCVIILFI